MAEEIKGYYTRRKGTLLKEFDQTAVLMMEPLHVRYGEEFADALRWEVRQEYARLIPEIPYCKGGLRARMLNSFLVITAQEVAVYNAAKKHGIPAAQAWELCHEALRLRLADYPVWKRWIMRRVMFSPLVARLFERRARKNLRGHFGGFEVEYVAADSSADSTADSATGEGFNLGINYRRCGNLDFALAHGGEEFAPFVCMSDIALSDALGWGLVRTRTLADGCEYCDFRFKKGGATMISSRTPEVQETIVRLNNKPR